MISILTSSIRPALLAFATDPNHALVLLLAGILLIYAEANRPGTVVLGCAGCFSFLLGVFGLLHLSLAPPAIAVVALALVLLALGIFFPRWNACTLLVCATLALGLARLNAQVDPVLAAACSAIFTAASTWLLRIALQARRNKRLPVLRRLIPAGESHSAPARSRAPHVQHPADAPPSSQPTA